MWGYEWLEESVEETTKEKKMIGNNEVRESYGECAGCHRTELLGDRLCQQCWDRQVSGSALPNSAEIQEMLQVAEKVERYWLRAEAESLPRSNTERCARCNTWTGGALYCSNCRRDPV